MVAQALFLQGHLQAFITKAKSINPNCSIMLCMPNSIGVAASTIITSGATGQQITDVLRLTYRGDAALGVPRLDTINANVLLVDTMGTIYSDVAPTAASVNSVLHEVALVHPSSPGYAIKFEHSTLLKTPYSVPYNTDPAYHEKVLATGRALTNTTILTANDIKNSGDYYSIAPVSLADFSGAATAGAIGTFRLGFESSAMATWAFGNATTPSGVCIGDIIVWDNGYVMPIRAMADNYPALANYVQWTWHYTPDALDMFTIKNLLPAGTLGTVYRSKNAYSQKKQWNDYLLANSMGNYAKQNAIYKYAYRFVLTNTPSGTYFNAITNNLNGSIKFQPVAGELESNGLNCFTHTHSALDVLCLSGIECGSDNQISRYGILLTGSTVDKVTGAASQTTQLNFAGSDFRHVNFAQGFILSNS
jgi:hypothetical protein